MNRTVYLNGAWLAEADAHVSIFDRGFLFADAIYEVTGVVNGKLLEYEGHSARLQRSMGELGLVCPLSPEELLGVHREIVHRNALSEGLIYLQISRGPADRDFAFPANPVPTLVLFTQAKAVLDNPKARTGISVALLPDLRWARCDIKTVQLLYPSMAKMEAARQGADDAWLVEDGFVTEASSASAHIITSDGVLVTRPLSQAILHGITRHSVLDLATTIGVAVEERPFSVEEAKTAAEAFITSATNFVLPVTQIDGQLIGDGQPGPLTLRLRELYIERKIASAI
ncbi:D-alanine transaminase [Rhizobium sp. PP-F2F-G38]|uniref:D-amino-acid transaminase n=1 Tax=Rhizobium sp. PP-CC-3G-465 TaxID=2135648 RepID=UPI000D93DE58|nr:D-alanine transaminase [Rhizobium sp. PP-WC-1G-195]PYE94802.1 D-alanine transaminase [Rhizobium sp. PP-F2F-G38]TCQ05379.1 D-alanine transaminase [Rhizobium sp. PP-F2F-G36]TCQ26018.1 D-alanine transaminase [Rhizobium sp. PP-CC-3G-465]